MGRKKIFLLILVFLLGFLTCVELVRNPTRVVFSSSMTPGDIDSIQGQLRKKGVLLILNDTAFRNNRLRKIKGEMIFEPNGYSAGFGADGNFGKVVVERDLWKNGGLGSVYVYGKE